MRIKNSIGLVCDLNYSRHPLFKNYYYGIANVLRTPRIVRNVEDLIGVDILFIGDDHYGPHKDVWMQDHFINFCNDMEIQVVVFTNEKTLNSFFPWNVEILNNLKKFRYLHHAMSDVEDCIAEKAVLNRMAVSKSLVPIIDVLPKKDKMVFIGNTKCKSYAERRKVLKSISKKVKIDIVEPKFDKWEDYMKFIAGYRYVFSPAGNANFFPMRFYEILAVKSIPVHQVKSNTLEFYDIEADFEDCIFFEDVAQIPDKMQNFGHQMSHSTYFMEDNIRDVLKKFNII